MRFEVIIFLMLLIAYALLLEGQQEARELRHYCAAVKAGQIEDYKKIYYNRCKAIASTK